MRTDGRSFSRSRVAAWATALGLVATTVAGAGNPIPRRVTVDSLEPAQALVPPGLEWCVRRGWNLEVEGPRRVAIPSRVKQATEKFAAQVALADEGKNLHGYVAGLPFPILDPSDPDVATKIVWNHLLSWRATDDLHLTGIGAEAGSITEEGGFRVENRFVIPSYRELGYVGRVYVEPTPRLFEWSKVARAALIESFREPLDLQNTSLLRIRYMDGARDDDLYAYLPYGRRVRRLPSVDPSQAPFGQDLDLDSVWGFSGKVGDLEWRFLGEREILAAVHARNVPVRWSEDGFGFEDAWEPRKVFVVEGKPAETGYEYGRRILYVDRESFTVVHAEMYDRSGGLWKVWIPLLSFSGLPGMTSFPEEGSFPHYVALVMVDTRASHVTRVSIPATPIDGAAWTTNGGPAAGTIPRSFEPAHIGRTGLN